MEQNGSKKWLYTVRLIMVLLGIVQFVLIGWVKFVTSEVIDNKSAVAILGSELKGIKEDLNYIRDRIDKKWDK